MCKFLIIILFPCLLNAQQGQGSLSDRFKGRDSTTVILSIIRCNKLKAFFPKNIFEKYYDVNEHSFKTSFSLIYKEIEKIYNCSNSKYIILNNIDKWLSNDSLLSILEENDLVPIEQGWYNNKHTRRLFNKYLQHRGQTWESLSTWQSYELYIDFLNYAQSLSPVEINDLFRSLSITIKTIRSKKSHYSES